jgi:antitoxin component YwqK of YwqJK toxin-antitoxin module
MVLKESLLNNLFFGFICIFTFGCEQPIEKKATKVFEKIAVSKIPNDTILENNKNLKLLNGVYYFGDKPYSGFIKELYVSDTLKYIGSYYKGEQHGTTKTFFPNGKLESERSYKNGLSYGRHVGFWENGNIKFDYQYLDDSKEGIQKQWYDSGKKYYELTFKDDQENGMQKAWRENGKLYINYEVRDGIKYGLQKSALCYTLKNGKLK